MTHFSELHKEWMGLALAEAEQTRQSGDVPIGAVVLDATGRVVGRGRNRREADADPTGRRATPVLISRDTLAVDPDGFRWEICHNPGPIGQKVLP